MALSMSTKNAADKDDAVKRLALLGRAVPEAPDDDEGADDVVAVMEPADEGEEDVAAAICFVQSLVKFSMRQQTDQRSLLMRRLSSCSKRGPSRYYMRIQISLGIPFTEEAYPALTCAWNVESCHVELKWPRLVYHVLKLPELPLPRSTVTFVSRYHAIG